MTSYDDAELAAIKLERLAAGEEDGRLASAEMRQVAEDLFERHGSDGTVGLIAALARHCATAFDVISRTRGITTEQLINDFEMDKLDQIVNKEEE